MKYHLHLLTISILSFLIGCAPSTVLYDWNDSYVDHTLAPSSMAVCPFNGEWRITSHGDSIQNRVPGLPDYTYAVARKIAEERPCLRVIYPERTEALEPNIEYVVFKHRLSFRNPTALDTAALRYLRNSLNSDYLLFFERVLFAISRGTTGNAYLQTTTKAKRSTIVFQLWDLTNTTFVQRGESSGVGMDVADIMKEYSSKASVVATAEELAKNLPKCKTQ